jgi:DNA-binding response OmpR family regulator
MDMEMTKRILVIDDDKAVNGCFFVALEGEGMKVDCAFTGMEAMELAEQFRYDLMILDYRLPDLNGEIFLREVALTRKTKVLLVTGYLTLAMVKVMFKLGICGYLAKPVGRDELVYNVQFHLSSTKPQAYTK